MKRSLVIRLLTILAGLFVLFGIDWLQDYYTSYQEEKEIKEKRAELVEEFGEHTVSYFKYQLTIQQELLKSCI